MVQDACRPQHITDLGTVGDAVHLMHEALPPHERTSCTTSCTTNDGASAECVKTLDALWGTAACCGELRRDGITDTPDVQGRTSWPRCRGLGIEVVRDTSDNVTGMMFMILTWRTRRLYDAQQGHVPLWRMCAQPMVVLVGQRLAQAATCDNPDWWSGPRASGNALL